MVALVLLYNSLHVDERPKKNCHFKVLKREFENFLLEKPGQIKNASYNAFKLFDSLINYLLYN